MINKEILLHICCSPCSIEVIEVLNKSGFEIFGYFYNPNIHPFDEYIKRRDSVIKYLEKLNLKYEVGDYEIYNYFKNISGNLKGSERCDTCYKFRIEKTVKKAKNLRFTNFSTTLIFNPHKDYNRIAKLAGKIAKENYLNFVNPALKRDYWENKEKAKNEGLYFQKYCGCVSSMN